jgi:DnaJ-domain-containing protein 1
MLMYLFYAALAFAVYKAVTLTGGLAGNKVKPKQKRRSKIAAKKPHEVLGVTATASPSEIKRAYQKLMAKYHPDRVANAAEELQALAEKRSKEINAAYATMMKGAAN